jgi:hypothetical protein
MAKGGMFGSVAGHGTKSMQMNAKGLQTPANRPIMNKMDRSRPAIAGRKLKGKR